MKKYVWVGILCLALMGSALSFAEGADENVFEVDLGEVTVTLDMVTLGEEGAAAALSMLFDSEETAQQYEMNLLNSKASLQELETRFRAMGGEEPKKLVIVEFKTSDGVSIFPEDYREVPTFGPTTEPYEETEGVWRVEIYFDATGFATEEDDLVVECRVFDTQGDAPYTGEVEGTLVFRGL